MRILAVFGVLTLATIADLKAQVTFGPMPPIGALWRASDFSATLSATASNWAKQATFISDIDGDGKRDVVVIGGNSPNMPIGTMGYQVRAIGSATGSTMWLVPWSPGPFLLGEFVATIDDCDGDGFLDVAVTAQSSPNGTPPAIFVYSGLTGSQIYSIPNMAVFGLWSAHQICRLGSDFDADGVNDYCVGCPLADNLGQFGTSGNGAVKIISGVNGALIVQKIGSVPSNGLGIEIVCLGDMDADGFPDVVSRAGADMNQPPSATNVYGLACRPSGITTGYQIPNTTSTPSVSNGWSALAAAGDQDLDGISDFVLCNGTTGAVPLPPEIRSGASGALIRTLQVPPTSGAFFQWGAAHVGDMDGDGRDDVAVAGTLPQPYAPGIQCVFSGGDGSPLFSGAAIGSLWDSADYDGDGLADLLVTVPDQSIRVLLGTTVFSAVAARGNVMSAGATYVDTLRVSDNSTLLPTMGGPGRTAVYSIGTALDLWMAKPPLHAAPMANTIVFGRFEPQASFSTTPLPLGIGNICFAPALLNSTDPNLFVFGSSWGGGAVQVYPAYLGGAGSPVAQTPSISVPVSMWFQGLIENSASAAAVPLSLTNALRVIIR